MVIKDFIAPRRWPAQRALVVDLNLLGVKGIAVQLDRAAAEVDRYFPELTAQRDGRI
jgi:hypothetical protein